MNNIQPVNTDVDISTHTHTHTHTHTSISERRTADNGQSTASLENEIQSRGLVENPVNLIVNKDLEVNSSIDTDLPEEETILYENEFDGVDWNPQTSYTIPKNVNIIKSYFDIGGEIRQTHYIKVSAGKTYNVPKNIAGKEQFEELIVSDTGIQYNNGTTNARVVYLKISYSASINKETNIYNSDYLDDDNYVYYYVATSIKQQYRKCQVTKNTTWRQMIETGQNYCNASIPQDGTPFVTIDNRINVKIFIDDIIQSESYNLFLEPSGGVIVS